MDAFARQLTRRVCLSLTTIGAGSQAMSRLADAQTYPAGPVRIVVGFPPGGPLDLAAHVIAPWLTTAFKQPFTIENRVGASGNLATQHVAQSSPDGRTLLLCGPVNTINTTLFGTADVDFERVITPIASIARVPLVLEVHPSVPARSVSEFLALARSAPGRLKVAYAGVGTPQHVAIELFKMMAHIDLTMVPYAGSTPALVDLLEGKVQVMFDPLSSSFAHIKAGRLIPLAVTSTARSESLPTVPCASDTVPGYEAGSWFGIGAPKGVSPEIVSALNTLINTALRDSEVRARLADIGAMPMPMSPEQFAAFVTSETRKYASVIETAHIKAN